MTTSQTIPTQSSLSERLNALPVSQNREISVRHGEVARQPMESTWSMTAPDEYTIAIVCAMVHEFDPVRALFDGGKSCTYHGPSYDNNIYIVGRFADHHTVLVMPGGKGELDAGMCTQRLRDHFSNIELTLLVGTCGTIPWNHETKSPIYLGDVIVGTQVWRYLHDARASQLQSGGVEIELRNLVAESASQRVQQLGNLLKTEDFQDETSDCTLLNLNALQKRKRGVKYNYPGYDSDQLCEPESHHRHNPDNISCSCSNPDKSNCQRAKDTPCKDLGCKVERVRSQANHPPIPGIHIGTIASADIVMRAASEFSGDFKMHNILGVDMEGGGVSKASDCIIIKGAVDYSDTHKNKYFDHYAAGVAASVAKAFLLTLYRGNTSTAPQSPLFRTQSQPAVNQSFIPSNESSRFLALSRLPEWKVNFVRPNLTIFENISDYEPSRAYRNYSRLKCQGTANWILEHKTYISWSEGNLQCIWLSVGSGKTLLTTSVIQDILSSSNEDLDFGAHFFFDHSNKARLEAAHLFRSYLKQMINFIYRVGLNCPTVAVTQIRQLFSSPLHPPNFEEILDTFTVLNTFLQEFCHSVIYILDGLDECEEKEQVKVLKVFRNLMTPNGPRIFISGRENLDVTRQVPSSVRISVTSEANRKDTCIFIKTRIKEKMLERRLTENPTIIDEIEKKLAEKADLMILWVHLQLETLWDECSTDADIRNALNNLPNDLEETYNRCLARISRRQSRLAPKILSWVCMAVNPFTVTQLCEALAIDTETGRINWNELAVSQDILTSCSNLIMLNDTGEVFLAHHSVKLFLLGKGSDHPVFSKRLDLTKSKTELGELCISHLASYSLAVQHPKKPQKLKTPLTSSTWNRMTEPIPPLLRRIVKPPKANSIVWPSATLQAAPKKGLPSFFEFAREQWAPLTNEITQLSYRWNQFERIALEPNTSWRWHPWEPVGESLESHYLCLLGWAIASSHLPLLNCLLNTQGAPWKKNIFNLPLPHHHDLPALHLAARVGNVNLLRELVPKCDPRITDKKGRTALHHAAEMGSTQAIDLLSVRRVVLFDQDDLQDDLGRTPLLSAAYHGHQNAVRLLIRLGADLKASDKHGHTAIKLAAGNGHWAVIFELLQHAVALDTEEQETLAASLFYAVEHGEVGFAQLLLKNGAEVEYENKQGRTPLWCAAHNGHRIMAELFVLHGASHREPLFFAVSDSDLRAVEILLENGVDVNLKNFVGFTALEHAAKNGHIKLVKFLIEKGARIDSKDYEGRTALCYATIHGHKEIVKLLLENGANLNLKDDSGLTVLLHAAQKGHSDVVKFLLEKGAHIDSKDNGGRTALYYATIYSRKEVAQLLLEVGSEVNLEDESWFPVLLLHAAKNGHDKVVKLLLEEGPYIDSNDNRGLTELHHTTLHRKNTVMQLLENGADIDLEDDFGLTILLYGLETKDSKLIDVGLEMGTSINSKDNSHSEALHYAAIHGYNRIVKVLLESGAGIDSRDNDGLTTLCHAAAHGHQGVVQVLLERGANIDHKDNHNRTALWHAAAHEHEAVVQVLLQAEADINSKDDYLTI